MDKWEEFEQECHEYLIREYSNIEFEKSGGSDSNTSDIKVTSKNKSFFIEVKMDKAQCGQFVLIPNKKKMIFEYSNKNKSDINEYSKKIIDFMNQNYKEFEKAGTKGKKIELDNNIFYNWIMNFYKNKNVKFIITKNSNFIILPIDKISDYFSVSAIYRMKKSGSSEPNNNNISEIEDFLNKKQVIFRTKKIGKSTFIETYSDLSNLKFNGEKYDFIFKEYKANTYKIRRLSNTCNSNIIFDINLKRNKINDDLILFEKYIK